MAVPFYSLLILPNATYVLDVVRDGAQLSLLQMVLLHVSVLQPNLLRFALALLAVLLLLLCQGSQTVHDYPGRLLSLMHTFTCVVWVYTRAHHTRMRVGVW